eukprot:scaffold23366_cov215-Cylindrotheca_fusiformis.AAC.7
MAVVIGNSSESICRAVNVACTARWRMTLWVCVLVWLASCSWMGGRSSSLPTWARRSKPSKKSW